ncbi:zinc-binding protein A33-like [Danio aesculapii]|uniref:zinc-binding protein A33-like n=1 Tax=Danio aesculapii TaxID=1142201 RepID=UPI0024BF20C5|nr:zinc-binding protein A33-like [Danio aesculapii]
MSSQAEYDYICPVCHEVFRVPVILPCGHSFCQRCVRQFWSGRRARECPVCRGSCRHLQPVVNLALKNLCEEFEKQRKHSRPEDMCSLHREKLKLFCLQDNQPVCVVCFTSQQHDQHTLRPVAEAAAARKDQLSAALKILQEKLQHREKTKEELQKTLQHIRAQAEQTERQIRLQFQKLHQFLRDEEEASVSAVREEEEQKQKMMKEKLEEINKHISDLSHAIREAEESMSSNSVRFLQEFPVSMERVQISPPDPQIPAGALINESRHLGNLMHRVWRKMENIVHHTPVILDPNTAHPDLLVSADLSSVRWSWSKRALPDNAERYDHHPCVLASEGIRSGTLSWAVEVRESSDWTLGVTTVLNQRKGWDFFSADVWSMCYDEYSVSERPVFGVRVKQRLERVRVDLDYDRGTVSFSDAVNNTHIHTFSSSFTHTLIPFFSCYTIFNLKILPSNSQQ